jgi:hypothetical protein
MATKEMCDEDSYNWDILANLHIQILVLLESIDINKISL